MSADGPPNVVLVTVDCFRYDRCGFTGYFRPTTPTLDRLANESMIFDNAFATGPYTAESFPGILAGRHGFNGAHYSNLIWKALRTDESSLASCLRDLGYTTIGVVTNPHLTIHRNFDHGFDHFENLRTGQTTDGEDGQAEDAGEIRAWVSSLITSIRQNARWNETSKYRPLYIFRRYKQLLTEYPSKRGESVIDDFIGYLDKSDDRKPFFGWTHLMDLHGPIHPESARAGGLIRAGSNFQQLLYDSARWSNIRSDGYHSMYDSTVRYVDGQISRIVEFLKEESVWHNTVLIVTADHGEALHDRGIYGHPYHYMFDELLRVPLLVRTPSSQSLRVKNAFSLAWIHELIADLVGTDRFDLPARSGRPDHLEACCDGNTVVISDSISSHGHTIAVRNSEYKYINHYGEPLYEEFPLLSEITRPYTRGVAYRTHSDQGERIPIDLDDVPFELHKMVSQKRKSPDDIPSLGEMNKSSLNQLRALGYRT
jgi:choline-sulfatase